MSRVVLLDRLLAASVGRGGGSGGGGGDNCVRRRVSLQRSWAETALKPQRGDSCLLVGGRMDG